MTWQAWVGIGGLMVAAGLTTLGFLAFWGQAPPIDGGPEPSWLQDSGERPTIGRHSPNHPERQAPPPPEILEPTGHAEEWMWSPAPPAPPAHHRWEHLGEQTRPMRPPNNRIE